MNRTRRRIPLPLGEAPNFMPVPNGSSTDHPPGVCRNSAACSYPVLVTLVSGPKSGLSNAITGVDSGRGRDRTLRGMAVAQYTIDDLS